MYFLAYRITSYINNLHPQKHKELYNVVEDVITRTIPLWNTTLTPLRADRWGSTRIPFDGPSFYPIPSQKLPRQKNDEDALDFEFRKEDWIRANRKVIQPEPGTFTPPIVPAEQPSEEFQPDKTVDLKRDYGHRGLQVIVKLANIHLTPEKSSYPGGSWHVEGQRVRHFLIHPFRILISCCYPERAYMRFSNLLLRQRKHHIQLSCV